MRPQELLGEAIDAAPQTARGLAELQKRVPPAESALQDARAALRTVQVEESTLADQRRALERSLTDANRDLRAGRPAIAAAYLDLLAGKPAVFDEIATKKRVLHDRRGAASETLEYLASKAATLAVRRIQAEIRVAEASKGWTCAA